MIDNNIHTLVGVNVIQEMLDALATTPTEGCIVEVGVYRGGTLWHFVRCADGRPVFGYDTFTGIPMYNPELDSHKVGDFGDTSLEQVAASVPGATLVKGLFPDSLIDMPPIAFAHIDCDQYESIKNCIDTLSPRMLHGGIMWFDDYGCFLGSTKAVDEAFGDRLLKAPSNKAYVRF